MVKSLEVRQHRERQLEKSPELRGTFDPGRNGASKCRVRSAEAQNLEGRACLRKPPEDPILLSATHVATRRRETILCEQ